MQLKYLNRKQIDFSRRCYDLFSMFFSDLFLSSSTNRRFLEVGSFLQLYIIIVGPSFFRQRVVVYKELLSMIFMHQRVQRALKHAASTGKVEE